MCLQGMSYLPVVFVVLSVSTFVLTYIVAIYRDDVAVYFPYISDTGTKPPESCIFSQLGNILAALCLCVIYVRYKLVEALGQSDPENRTLRRINKVGLVLGMITALGISLASNFQETNVEAVHVTGAVCLFGVGVVYAFVQTGLTYHMWPEFNGLYVCRARLTFSMLSLAAATVTFVAAVVSREKISPSTDKLHWKPEDPGFTAHVVSTISEWITAIIFLFFFLTYAQDFRRLKIEAKPQMHVRHLDEEPIYPDERTKLLATPQL